MTRSFYETFMTISFYETLMTLSPYIKHKFRNLLAATLHSLIYIDENMFTEATIILIWKSQPKPRITYENLSQNSVSHMKVSVTISNHIWNSQSISWITYKSLCQNLEIRYESINQNLESHMKLSVKILYHIKATYYELGLNTILYITWTNYMDG